MPEMKLNDLRRYAVQKRTPVTYRDAEGRTARVNSKGVAEIPGLKGRPPYKVDDVLAAAEEFLLEPEESKAPSRKVNRQKMAELISQLSPAAAAHQDEHE